MNQFNSKALDIIGFSVVPSKGYNKYVVPPPSDGQDKFQLNISLDFTSILYIDEVENNFKVKLNFSKNWYNRYLTYQNLHRKGDVNVIFDEDKEIMWMPYVESLNMEYKDKCKQTDRKPYFVVFLNPHFEFERSPITENENAYLFQGSKNMLHFENHYTCEFVCSFNFRWFPFDTQDCSMLFSVPERDIDIIGDIIKYSGPIDLVQYYFKATAISLKTSLRGLPVAIRLSQSISVES